MMGAVQRLAARARLICAGLDGEVPSPCLSVCRMDPAKALCEGCFRTLDEIAGWGRMRDEAKREVWEAIGERIEQAAHAPALSQREGGKEK
jgi:predicted Fe-S protein YdhL (DUF1289 family)